MAADIQDGNTAMDTQDRSWLAEALNALGFLALAFCEAALHGRGRASYGGWALVCAGCQEDGRNIFVPAHRKVASS